MAGGEGPSLIGGLGSLTAPIIAVTASSQWQFDALVYAYAGQLSGVLSFPMGRTANAGSMCALNQQATAY
jgi:hypothetical protein